MIGLAIWLLGFLVVLAYPIVRGRVYTAHIIFQVAVFWPLVVAYYAMYWPLLGMDIVGNKIVGGYNALLLKAATRKERKEREKQVKQLVYSSLDQAELKRHTDIEIEQSPIDYRHMHCTGCGKELVKK